MPRRRQAHRNYVDLADLVTRNCNHNHRHHPYNLRPSTLRRQPGSMNERVLWQNQINPPPPDYDEHEIIHRINLSSRSRLHFAAADQPTPAPMSAQTAQRINRMATATIVTPATPTEDSRKTNNSPNQFSVDETQSTVVLHQNPLFDAEGAKRSGMLSRKAQAKETSKKINTKKKRASVKGSSGSKPYSRLCGSAALKNKIEKAKQELDTSSSYGADFTRVESKNKKAATRIKSETEIEVAGCGESKDQELAPPPPPPMFPNVQGAQCSTLAAILESVDNFLRTVKKS